MNAHVCEVPIETRLKESTRRAIERLSWRAEGIVHDWRSFASGGGVNGFWAKRLLFFFLALLTFPADSPS
jgi:hypothetical protein